MLACQEESVVPYSTEHITFHRLSKWYAAYNEKEKRKMVREVSQLCLSRPQKLCNFLGE